MMPRKNQLLTPQGARKTATENSEKLIPASDDFCYQVVVVGLGDFAAIELAGLRSDVFWKVVNEDFAVNFRCVHGSPAFEEQVRFFRFAFEHEIEFAAN